MKEKEDKTDVAAKSEEGKETENPKETASEEIAVEKTENPREAASEENAVEKTVEETPAVANESSEVAPSAEQSTDPSYDAPEVSNDAATEQSGGNTEEENVGDQDEAEKTPEIKVFFHLTQFKHSSRIAI